MKKLKYLWVAELTDGTLIKQTPNDKSLLSDNHNCYHDLLETLKDETKKIRRFSIVGEGNTITVDLGNGIFYVNGLPVLLESDKLPTLPDRFELIWYHQVTQKTNVNVNTKSGKVLSMKDDPEFREYFIGWHCSISGKSYQQKIAVS